VLKNQFAPLRFGYRSQPQADGGIKRFVKLLIPSENLRSKTPVAPQLPLLRDVDFRTPARGFSALLPYRDYGTPSVAICIYSSL